MQFHHLRAALATLTISAATTSFAATTEFYFAQVNGSYSAFLSPTSELVGQQVTSARIYLDLHVDPGSDAADFFTDISFPILPDDGNTSALVLTGEELEWSGSGEFHYFRETTEFNGVFAAGRFGAETPIENFSGAILEGSRIEFDYVPEPGTALLLGLATAFARRSR